ncbi:MAG: peptidoglycan DD-metalloendopeptidase family protein [Saprospiraceae bacterium]|nr:peptidoglycan DD-metalloendopeptidase family protein [Saprospiraceae bacterium]
MSESTFRHGWFKNVYAAFVKQLRYWSCQFLQLFKFFGLILFLVTLGTVGLHGQNRKELEDKRKNLLKEIEQTSSMLKDTRQNQKATLNRYYTLQKQIGKRQELIATLQEEIFLADDQIERARGVVEALSVDVEVLKKEYAEMARVAYRQKLKNNYLLFLLSSDSFNEAFRRWNYLKQYDSYRQKQARLILDTQDMLENKMSNIEVKKAEKEDLLQSEMIQKGILEQELYDSDNLLAKLKADESRLQNDLVAKEKASQQLKDAIQKIILAEIERKKKEDEAKALAEAKKKKAKEPKKEVVPQLNTSPLTSGFSSNRGKLPWPVKGGVVTQKFGRQPHPILKNIQITNNGIDIQTPKSAEVKSVFEGKVLGMQFIPGNNYMVILQHGKYFTVYSNLEEVNVKRGDKIETNQMIGKVGLDKISGHYELHFEVWEDKNLENPSSWLSR